MAIDFNIAKMPYDLEAEQAVLGAVIIDPEKMSDIADMLSKNDFYFEKNAGIYEIMTSMYIQGKEIDVVTLLAEMKKNGRYDEGESKAYVLQLAEFVPTSTNIKKYAQIVWEKSILRALIGASQDIAQLCVEGGEDFQTIIDAAERKVYEIAQGNNTKEFKPLPQILIDVFEKISIMSKGGDEYKGLSTGFHDLDNMIGGLCKSDLIIIAARPGVGKTSLALNMAHHVTTKLKKGVAVFSLEMSKEQLVTRVLASEALISGKRLLRGEVQDNEWVRLTEATDVLSNCHLCIDDNPVITVAEMKSKLRREKGIDLVIIDYLQLMTGGAGRSENRVQEVSNITRNLKILAKELDVPVIALSQLSRPAKGKENELPQLSDLRESGSIEQDADIVLMLYRNTLASQFSDDFNMAKCRIAKNRHGETGDIDFTWNGEYTRFYSAEKHRDENA